jgi:hypothetical protein
MKIQEIKQTKLEFSMETGKDQNYNLRLNFLIKGSEWMIERWSINKNSLPWDLLGF